MSYLNRLEPLSTDWINELQRNIADLEQNAVQLLTLHQETTHVHEADLLKRAYELLTRIHEQPQKAIYFQAGLPFDVSNWIQRYEHYAASKVPRATDEEAR